MKKIIFIIHSLIPLGGGVRILKFCKYLPKFNWLPIIITSNTSTMTDIGAACTSTNELDKRVKIFYTKGIEKLGVEKKLAKAKTKLKLWVKIKKIIYSFLPDECIGWIPFCYKQINKILLKEKINVSYTTAPPFSTHIIGYILKRRRKIPWVADFRDLWFNNIVFEPKSRFKKLICRVIEKEFVKLADKIICATDPITEYFTFHYPKYKYKFITITNGYDKEEFKTAGQSKYKTKNKLTIAYTGTLSSEYQTPEYFLSALRIFIKENPEIKNDIEIIFAGHMLPKYIELLKEESLVSVAKFIGCINKKEVIDLICSAEVLLLIIYNEKGGETVLTTKLFDYIGAKKPIFALVPDGIAKELIMKEKLGIVVPSKDIEKIKEGIHNLYYLWKKNNLKETNKEFKLFERETLTKKLSEILNIITT